MSQKIWVIDDTPEQQVPATKTSQSTVSTVQKKNTKQRNPSLAYSLSFIIWGCGQFYNRQWRLGILFLIFMINFYLFMSIVVIHWQSIKSFLELIYVDFSEALLISGFFYFSGLVVWHLNAWQAYLKSKSISARSFNGIKMKLLPAVCSLLMPGWGQLLNGQTKKGLFFHVFAITGLATLPFILIIFLIWPTLEASRSRLIIEWIFSISIILLPFILIMWIFNIFDAVKVSLNNSKKVPLPIRIKYAIKKFRHHIQLYGRKNAVLPLIKRTTLIILLLVFCVINYHSVPEKFYMQQLQNLGNRMSEQEMTVIPSIIKKLLHNIKLGK
jgi:TM2 domain-containing membrane protein YozV